MQRSSKNCPLHCIVQTAMRQKLQCSKSTITNIINLKLAMLYYYEAVWGL
jgi:hypothetical protein